MQTAAWREFMTKISRPLSWPVVSLLAGGALALTVALPPTARAVDSTTPAPTPSNAVGARRQIGHQGREEEKAKERTKEKQTEQQFIDGYKAAHAMIYQHHDYTAASTS